MLAAHSKAEESFPILRGKFVRVGLLCQSLPPPPKVVPKAPEPAATSTSRERFAQHSSDPACAGCHKLIDPLGFGLENYDAIGRYRENENGKPVDASGVITGKSMGVITWCTRITGGCPAIRCTSDASALYAAVRISFRSTRSLPSPPGTGRCPSKIGPRRDRVHAAARTVSGVKPAAGSPIRRPVTDRINGPGVLP